MNSAPTRVQVVSLRVQREFGIVRAALITVQKLPAGSNNKQTVHISSAGLFLMFHTGTLLCFFVFFLPHILNLLCSFAFLLFLWGFHALIFCVWSMESTPLWWATEARYRDFSFKIINLYVLLFWTTSPVIHRTHTLHTFRMTQYFLSIFTSKLPQSQKDHHQQPCCLGQLHPPLIVKWIISYPNGVLCGWH